MMTQDDFYCFYSDLPSPLAYATEPTELAESMPPPHFSVKDIDRIIEMAWEDRTPFDAITYQFGLREGDVRRLMKEQLSSKGYKKWRTRVEACATKHAAKRSAEIKRFKSTRQRVISQNRIAKR